MVDLGEEQAIEDEDRRKRQGDQSGQAETERCAPSRVGGELYNNLDQ